jgi:hypothetical protein
MVMKASCSAPEYAAVEGQKSQLNRRDSFLRYIKAVGQN